MTLTRTRRAAVAAGMAGTLLAVAACSSGGSTPAATASSTGGSVTGEITLGYSAGGDWGKYIETTLDRIRTAYPGLTVKSVVYPTYDDLLNQLPNQFAANTAPDIIQWDGAAPIAQYASEGVIAPLDDAVAKSGKDLSAYPKSLISGWTIDNKLYGIPLFLQNSAVAYNTKMLTDAGVTSIPRTLDEYAAAAAAVSKTSGAKGVVLLDSLFHISQYLYAFGGGYDYGRTINSEQNIAGLTYLVKLFSDGYASTAKELGATWDGEAFAAGKAAMSDAGPWYVSFMKLTAPEMDYALMPLPSGSGTDQTVVAYSGGFSINQYTKNFDAAYAVIDMFANDQAQSELLASGTQVPAMTKYLKQYRDSTPAYAAFTDEVIANGRSLDYPLATTEFGNALVAGFQDLVYNPGKSTPKALLDSLQEQFGR